MDYAIRRMTRGDIGAIADTFARMNKRREQYERYFGENQSGRRVTLVAVAGEEVVGYANLLWESGYQPFRLEGIPEINDLNVIDEWRKRGVGTALIREAERVAGRAGRTVVGIGVGLTPDYSAARRLYPKLGYVPDGRGAHSTRYGAVTYLTKTL